MLSIPEEAARLWVAGCSEQERGWVPRRELESWLCLVHEVAVLRLPLLFGRAHADITLSEGGAVSTKNTPYDGPRGAASVVVMRSGRHFAELTVLSGYRLDPGGSHMLGEVEGIHAGGGSCVCECGSSDYFTGGACDNGREWRSRQKATVSACCSTLARAA